MAEKGLQLFLFRGENTFALRGERRRWEKEFIERHGPENLLILDGAPLKFRALLDEVGSAPFLSEKRLVVVEGIPKFSKEEVTLLPGVLHPSTVLLFSDPQPDRRLAGVKELLRIAHVREFPPLKGKALCSWIETFLREQKSSLTHGAQEVLLDVVGEDQEMLSQELRKLATFANGRPITREDVEHFVLPAGEREVWHLLHLLTAGREREALVYAESVLARGGSPQALWGSLLWMLENLLLVRAALREGKGNALERARELGVPFPSIRTLLPFAERLSEERVRRFLRETIVADIALKTGEYRATSEAPEELAALIDRFILHCCALQRTTH